MEAIKMEYNPIGKFSLEEMLHFLGLTYGNDFVKQHREYYEKVDLLDYTSDDFHDYWIEIYINIKIAYGVKQGWLTIENGPFFINGINLPDYDLDIDHYLGNMDEWPSLYHYYHENNIEAYLPFV